MKKRKRHRLLEKRACSRKGKEIGYSEEESNKEEE